MVRRVRTPVRLFWRAIRLRCPNCGAGQLFESWFRIRPRCPQCGLATERQEDGYQVGAYMLNIVASELIFAAMFLGVLWYTWPEPPWPMLQIVGVSVMILAPFLFYPFSKTLFLAFDLAFRPANQDELV
ncbi:MAG TPA: DUF983 domain-containing protein [Gemmatimonadales bacterium]|nr:DUF983 domain-containing protein [Gemmatimonadales bacterium]